MTELRFQAETIVPRILEAARPYEFDTFVVGFERRENESAATAERLRRIKSLVGVELARAWPERRADFKRPEARIDVGRDLSVEIRTLPLFIAGRYRKLSRTVPASRWMCLRCDGKGCEGCAWTGNLCGPSIQELISTSLLELTGGETTHFHGSGREDTDARMLGSGRPFVIEVTQPVRRKIDLDHWLRRTAIDAFGVCEILAPAFVERDAVRAVKECAAEKTYRAWIRFGSPPPSDTPERLSRLAGARIEQLSPTRVMHRRGRSALRPKRVIESRFLGFLEGLGVWEVRTESGAYIKELISGDGGRTRPSVTEILGVDARCEALDVLHIHWRGAWERTPEAMASDGSHRAATDPSSAGQAKDVIANEGSRASGPEVSKR